jgi:hypothetical protein
MFGAVKKILGIDYHIGYGILFRVWAVLAGSVTIVLIPLYLTPIEQGFFFTFSALIAIQIFFELGFNHVLTLLSSQAKAHLKLSALNTLEGDDQWKYRINYLLQIATRWYLIMSTLLFFVLAIGGYLFFKAGRSNEGVEWEVVWMSISVFIPINLFLSSRLAIFEGLGEYGNISKLRLCQSIIGNTVQWALLASGAGLAAALCVPLSCAALTSYWVIKKNISKNFSVKKSDLNNFESTISYRRDIYPLQWRIAVSWASAYFIFNFVTPVVFAKHGEVEAGKIGLALSVFASLSSIGTSWVSAKITDFAQLVERYERGKLNTIFVQVTTRAFCCTLFLGAVFFIVLHFSIIMGLKISDRLPETEIMVALSIVTLVNVIIYSLSAYIRAHGVEPMTLNSVISAILIIMSFHLIGHLSPKIIIYSYCAVVVLVTLPWVLVLFRKYRCMPDSREI